MPSNDEFNYQRVYPAATASLFAQVVGYQSIQIGSAGVEDAYASELEGRTFDLQRATTSPTRSRTSSRSAPSCSRCRRSRRARRPFALAGKRGSVVVLDVQTGGVVAVYSNPTFDPNLLATHDVKKAQAAYTLLTEGPDNPLLSRAWRELYPPGSTFKTVTASIALQNNVDVNKKFPVLDHLAPARDERRPLQNFGDEHCGGSLEDGLHRRRATRPTARSGSTSATGSRPGIQGFGVQTAPPIERLRARPAASSRAPARRPGRSSRTSPVRAGRDRPGPGRCHADGDGARRRSGRDRRRDPAAARRRLQIDPNGKVVTRVGVEQYKRAIDPATAATMRNVHARSRERPAGNRHRRTDPRRSRSRARPAPRRPRPTRSRTRGSSRSRRPTTRSTRSRCSSSTADLGRGAEVDRRPRRRADRRASPPDVARTYPGDRSRRAVRQPGSSPSGR